MGFVAHRAKLCFVLVRYWITPSKEWGQQMAEIKNGADACGFSSWWAIYTRHQHEKVVADTLSSKGFDVFLPLYESLRRWKDRQKLISLPLFPCYVFVRGGSGHRLPILTTPGVYMILSRGEQVAVIPDEEIRAIRQTVEGNFRVEPHPFLRCGERIRVTHGSLQGVEGILVRKKNIFRLILSVDMLAQSVAVEVNASDVEPVAPRNAAALATSDPSTSIPLPPQTDRQRVADSAVSAA